MPATAFVGPLDPARASDRDLCADPPDYEKLLRSGAFGWRVMVLRGDESWIPIDGNLQRVDGPRVDAARSNIENASRWFAIRCGREAPTHSLMVVDAAANVVLPDFFVSHFLVRDPNPGERAAAHPPLDDHAWATLVRPDRNWAVLMGDAGGAAEFAQLSDAVGYLSNRGVGVAVFQVDSDDTWGAAMAAIDAFTRAGIHVSLTTLSGPRPPPPAPARRLPLTLGDELDVLVLRRRAGRPLLLQMIGTTGNASGDAVPDVLGDEGAAMAGFDTLPGGVSVVQRDAR